MINKRLTHCAVLIAFVFCIASGCAKPAGNTAAPYTATIVPEVSETPVTSEAKATPVPSDWELGDASDNGDIVINSEILGGLKAREYKFDKKPTILIYHTHAAEAFLQNKKYKYVESEEWRTLNNDKNIVHAGEVLKKKLKALGFKVIHDKTNVEAPELESAYSRSLEVMKKYKGVDIYIDLHRNAADPKKVKDNTVSVNGKACAKMFFVVGTGVGTYDGEYDITPDWKANYTFALSVMDKMSEYSADLVKPIRTKVGRFNQHMGMCLLVELGNNANTMQEALNSIPYLAKAIREVIKF